MLKAKISFNKIRDVLQAEIDQAICTFITLTKTNIIFRNKDLIF